MENKSSARLKELVAESRVAFHDGDIITCRSIAKALIDEFPKSEVGWLVLASISPPGEAKGYLEQALNVNSKSQAIQKGIDHIENNLLEKSQPPTSAYKPDLVDTQPIIIPKRDSNAEELNVETNYPMIHEKSAEQIDKNFSNIPPSYKKDKTDSSDDVDISKDNGTPSLKKQQLFADKLLKEKTQRKFPSDRILPGENIQSKISKADHGRIKKNLNNHEISEILIVAIGAILFPIIVFLYFFITK